MKDEKQTKDTSVSSTPKDGQAVRVKTEEKVEFKGKYISAVGKRKTAVARIRLYKKGKGVMVINNDKPSKYFSQDKIAVAQQPLKLTSLIRDLDISVVVAGGGVRSQAEAIRHGISRALVLMDEKLKDQIKTKGFLKRDPRKKERKKPGLKKARKAPQWSKR
jgi:small subunit ribosomal protein S9